MSAAAERTPKLDKYELLEEIGHGGMATVYRAVDRRLGREVATKVIHRHLRENQEVAARFVSEARAVAKLKHPNIVEVYDVSAEADPEQYLVVELVRGVSFRQLLRKHKFLPAEIAAAIGIEIAAGLEHAHQHGVIHRDVKPENVLVELPSEGAAGPEEVMYAQVKITDFGIAKMLDQQGVTSTGQVLGSPAHMAPEQIEGGAVSARSDVFGLGVLLYEAMVGRLPFDGQNPAQVLRRVLDGGFTPPERCRPTVGAALSAVVSKALSHRSEERYASAWELAEALRAELALVEFAEPRRELTSFLSNPEAYRVRYEAHMVTLLVNRARGARQSGNVPLAAALFNRALAFRPDDPELLSEVAGLARSRRLRRAAFRTAWTLAGAVALGGGLFAVYRSSASGEARQQAGRRSPAIEHQPPRQPEPAAPATGKANELRPRAPSSTGKGRPGGASKLEPKPVGIPMLRPVTSAVQPDPKDDPPRLAKVRVSIGGASGGKLKIDGELRREWFGVLFELPPGPHTFEFVPPNETCCKAPGPKTVTIADTAEEQVVRGEIDFREATVRFAGQPDSVLRCPELFSKELRDSEQWKVPMNQSELEARCYVVPGPSSGKPSSQIDVTLKPGGTLTVPEP